MDQKQKTVLYPTNKQDYNLISILGTGYFGPVWKAEIISQPLKGIFVTVKKIDMDQLRDQKIEEIRKKILLLHVLNHHNLVQYKISFVSGRELWVIFEIMDCGSIEQVLKILYLNKGIQDQILIATILKEALQGLEYLHLNDQIHRDIKSANILLDKDGRIAISDFGLTTKLKKNKKNTSAVGSVCWMAPEVLDSEQTYDTKADIWSLGITAYEMAYGKPPNSEISAIKAIMNIVNCEPPQLDRDGPWNESFYEFMNSCLQKDPNQRKSASDLLKLKFFKQAKGREYLKEKLSKNIKFEQQKINLDQNNQLFDNLQFQFDFTEQSQKQDYDNEEESSKNIIYNKCIDFNAHQNNLNGLQQNNKLSVQNQANKSNYNNRDLCQQNDDNIELLEEEEQ